MAPALLVVVVLVVVVFCSGAVRRAAPAALFCAVYQVTFYFSDGFSAPVRGDYSTVLGYFDAWIECKEGKREGLLLRSLARPHVSAVDLALAYRAEVVSL